MKVLTLFLRLSASFPAIFIKRFSNTEGPWAANSLMVAAPVSAIQPAAALDTFPGRQAIVTLLVLNPDPLICEHVQWLLFCLLCLLGFVRQQQGTEGRAPKGKAEAASPSGLAPEVTAADSTFGGSSQQFTGTLREGQ